MEDQVWLPSRLALRSARVGLIGGLAAPLAGALASLAFHSPGPLVTCLFLGLPTAFFSHRYGLRPAIHGTPTELIVCNPWHTTHLPRRDVRVVHAGYNGLQIKTTDDTVIAWAVQKSNLKTWTKKETRADRIASAIEDWAGSDHA